MIKNYLKYLKDISRKIIFDSGFEKSLIDRSKKNRSLTIQFSEELLKINRNNKYFKYFKYIENNIIINSEKKLFLGFGIITGTKGRIFAAPLLYVETLIEHKNFEDSYEISVDFNNINFNYDLLTAILNYGKTPRINPNNDEDDLFDEQLVAEIEIIEDIEKKIENIKNIKQLIELTDELFLKLQSNLEDFKDISTLENNLYNYEEEVELYNFNKKNKNIKNKNLSIFESNLTFINANHYFVNTVPSQLSTFKALSNLVLEVENNNFENEVLKKLILNVLTDKKAKYSEYEEFNIEEIIKQFIPLNFSDSQLSAIKSAFGSDVSYIQGPPGTGKSYTISGIILCAILLNKKVLIVSQKEAALNVIKEKLSDYFFYNDIFTLVYFSKDSKNYLRDNLLKIRKYANNQELLNGLIKKIKKEISYYEKNISLLTKKINKNKDILEKNLNTEYEIKKLRTDFVKLRDHFLNDDSISNEFKFKNKYNFNYYNNISKSKNLLKIIEKLLNSEQNRLTALNLKKIKILLENTFKVNCKNIKNSVFYNYTESLLKLNKINYEIENLEKNLIYDNYNLRKTIENAEIELKDTQTFFIKSKISLNLFSKISKLDDSDYRSNLDNIDNFKKMLFFNKSTRISEKMGTIEFSDIFNLLPIWLSEVRYLGEVLPMKPKIFDLVIVDEASQVNLAEILPAFYRGHKICVVGDHEQLGLDSSGVNFRLSTRFDKLTWIKNFNEFNISFNLATERKLTVTQCSILDMVRSEFNKESIRDEFLNEHFRSMPLLAQYTNKNFYDSMLRIMTETPENIEKYCFKPIKINGFRNEKKEIYEEAKCIIDIIKLITNPNYNGNIIYKDENINLNYVEGKKPSIGIVSLMTQQKNLIQDLIFEEFDDEILLSHNIEVWTPQSAQGNERDIIFISVCLDPNSSGGNYHKRKDLLNVATSRAKLFTFVIHSGFDINKYSQLKSYLNLNDTKIDWTLNHNAYESEFEKKVYEYLKKYISNKKDSNISIYNQVETCGQKRLDFVLVNKNKKKSVAVEVDGAYHFITKDTVLKYSDEHCERIDILKRAGWNIINTPYYKWYSNGWLCDDSHPKFEEELIRIYASLDKYLI